MTLKATFYDGALKRYEVAVECLSPDSRVREAYNGNTRTTVMVFATTRNGALASAVAKMQDKWLRHQDLRTEWTAHGAWEA
jgi:hypothetical protein